MKIVLCDDSIQELTDLEKRVRNYLIKKKNLHFTVFTYQSSEELWFKLEDEAIADVYILDIDMPGQNGIDIADRLIHLYPHVILFFYTSHTEYASQGYQMEVKRYILKSAPEVELIEALDYACHMFEKSQKDRISIFTSHDTINIPANEILYVERLERELKITTQNDGTLYDRRSLKEFHKQLKGDSFIMIDKGKLINVDFVYKTKDNVVTMFDQTSFIISRRRISFVKEAIMKYWKEV